MARTFSIHSVSSTTNIVSFWTGYEQKHHHIREFIDIHISFIHTIRRRRKCSSRAACFPHGQSSVDYRIGDNNSE